MYRLRMGLCPLIGAALLAGCTDPNTPTAPSTRPLAATAAVGSLIELSRPNAVGTCDDGFGGGAWPVDQAEEPSVAVNPVDPNNIVAAWIQGPFQDIIAAASFDGGKTWQQVPVPLTTCAGGQFLGAKESHGSRSEEHTSELQSLAYLVCRLLLEKKKKTQHRNRDKKGCTRINALAITLKLFKNICIQRISRQS